MTVDLRTPTGPGSWPFDEEEFEFTCMLDTRQVFSSQILGDPVLVLHRFGGTYGPVRYELRAAHPAKGLTGDDYLQPGDHGACSILLSFANRWGVPVRTVELPVQFVPSRRARLRGSGQGQSALSEAPSIFVEAQPGTAEAEPGAFEGEPSQQSSRTRWPADRSSAFNHVVVIMFGGRSFDNVLGQLYRPGEVRAFEGVLGQTLSNPVPEWAGSSMSVVRYGVASGMGGPSPPPGDEYPHVNTQLFGLFDPPGNRNRPAREMSAPYNSPSDSRQQPSMDGFVADYISEFPASLGRPPSPDEFAQVMTGYTAEQLPVMSALARGFAAFDHWFCDVPSQSFANRSFFHSGTSSGYVLDGAPANSFPAHNTAETIFERLESRGLSWRVYCDPPSYFSLTGVLHAQRLLPRFATNFFTTSRFLDDAAAGDLPAYSFIEPNILYGHNDMRPNWATFPGAELDPPSSLLEGEALLARIYAAVRSSAAPTGSSALNTLLIVTFDGHGGCYDHVPPPLAPPSDPRATAGQMGFAFDRSGVRVPTIAISAWIPERTVATSEYRGTSVIATLRRRWDLGPPLTGRDAAAGDISPVMALDQPRDPADWPDVIARPAPTVRPAMASSGSLRGLPRSAFLAALELARASGLSAPRIAEDREIVSSDASAISSEIFSRMFPGLARS